MGSSFWQEGVHLRRRARPAGSLPDELLRLSGCFRARLGTAGRREYVQVLRLLEDFSLEDIRFAAPLKLGTISFDAVKHLLL